MSAARDVPQCEGVLGEGEFGAVYQCVGPFDQVYAVKMMRPANRPYAEVQAEWAKEVQRLLSLRHPNVVYIHDAFEQGYLFYLALERCDHPLSAMLGTPMQEGLVLELARQLLAAVQFLHDNDVVHDDLHPGNVLITHAADRPVREDRDFGISHELRGLPSVRPNVVHHAIMAPEILVLRTHEPAERHLPGGAPPLLDADGTVGDRHAGALRRSSCARCRTESRAGSAEAIGTPLGALIAKMVRRREAYRYASAREVWADLRQLPAWQRRALFPAK